jgi:hypothetical protein
MCLLSSVLPIAVVLASFERRALIVAPEIAVLVCSVRHPDSPHLARILGSVGNQPGRAKANRSIRRIDGIRSDSRIGNGRSNEARDCASRKANESRQMRQDLTFDL